MNLSSPVHFIGISGIGMSALARVLLARGIEVTGSSDRRTAITDALAAEGARVTVGHAAENVASAKTVVATSAVSGDNSEMVAARERGLAILPRGTLLAHLMSDARGIAVAGTHGKTTTTAMLASVLAAGDLDPTLVLGGELVDGGTNVRIGASRWLLAEADESDGSFLSLRPEIAVVTNVENDHISSDAEMPALVAAFERFLACVPEHGLTFVGTDEPRAAELAQVTRPSRTVTFGFGRADVAARNVRYGGFGSQFEVEVSGRPAGTLVLRVPGAINILNALPGIALGCELDVPFERIAEALANFRGVRRRFEIVVRSPRMTVVDDYAHHPTEVEATLAAARANWSGPLVAAFQPHRYSRTQYLADGFARALAAADRVVLAPVYAASESPIDGADARAIGEPLSRAGGDVAYVDAIESLPDMLLELAPPGALVLCLGAGTISDAAHALARRVRELDASAARVPAR